MAMMLVLNTCPDKKTANKIAESLVQKKLAACVSIVALDRSLYRWRGRIVQAKEWLLLIKTKASLYGRVEAHIKANHPHETPEIIGFSIKKGDKRYLAWVGKNTAMP
jgi:periplasmic divalent cation tolerance protein